MTTIESYVNELFAQEDEALVWAREAPQREAMPQISIQPYEGRILQFLAQTINARRIVEIGTLAGYSGIWLARALPAEGHLHTLEISSKHVDVARTNFEKAGVTDRITILHGNATEQLKNLDKRGPFDMIFLDAKRDDYLTYLEWAAINLRVGGLLTAHNAHRGALASDQPDNEDAILMHQFNQAVADHPQFSSTIIGVGDGLLTALKVG